MHSAATQNTPVVLTVHALNHEVSQWLAQGFSELWVEGEISNLSRPASGHLYFSLKDPYAQLRCAFFRQNVYKNRFKPENGLKVRVRGRVGLYENRGDYQFIVGQIEAAGAGQLQQAFEALKQRLQQNGWFAAEYKTPLPSHPKAIGIITSPSAAALQDILQVLARRCPHIPIWVYPSLVQGQQAAASLCQALQQAQHHDRCDVLILARGGGSIEDLWAFNDETLAQAIFSSPIPIISGIGHEIDFTIADFVADQRAPTPSAAAEQCSPEYNLLKEQLTHLQQRLYALCQQALQSRIQQLQACQLRLDNQRPKQQLQQKMQQVDELETRLQAALQTQLQSCKHQLQLIQQQLYYRSPQQKIHTQREQLQAIRQQLVRHTRKKLDTHKNQFQQLLTQLNTLNPLATLERGYALAQTPDQQLITRAKQVTKGQSVVVALADGKLYCRVDKIMTNYDQN